MPAHDDAAFAHLIERFLQQVPRGVLDADVREVAQQASSRYDRSARVDDRQHMRVRIERDGHAARANQRRLRFGRAVVVNQYALIRVHVTLHP